MKKGGGMFDTLMGVQRIRGQRYEKWLEQRLVLVFNDVEYVNKIKKKFGYDKTNLTGRGQLTKEQVKQEVCARNPEDQNIIDPSLNCQSETIGGYKKTKKRKSSKNKNKNKNKRTRKH
jgi:hypothetical protein